ncbi:MAG: PKD domain-containing protein [Thermoanaerobaculia bacterium]
MSATVFLSLNPGWAAPKRVPDAPHLYILEKAAQIRVSPELVPDAAEEFLIEVDPAMVAANPPAFLLDLPGFPPLEAVRTRFVTYRPDWKSWFGTLRDARTGGEATGFIHIGYHGDQITAVIEHEGERYRIVGGVEESQRLVRLSGELSPPPCGLENTTDLMEPSLFREDRHSEGSRVLVKSATKAAGLKTTARIDVLAVYPKAFYTLSATVESGLFTFIQDSISLANNAFLNSGVDAFYNLVGIVPVLDVQPATGIFASLDWLNTEPSEVTALRNAFGADVVTVYVPFDWSSPNFCGVANLPQTGGGYRSGSGNYASFGQKAFTANRSGCGLNDFTLTHEIGHNYGMRHDDDSNDALDLFGYGRGHTLTVSGVLKATIMGCACGSSPKPACGSDISNAVCGRIPHFSDPNILYQGVATGVAPAGTDPGRNNALVGRNQVGTYSGYRTQSSNTPPTAKFSVSCCGRLCSFDASSSTDNVALPTTAANYKWDFGDGTTATGKNAGRLFAADGTYRLHLVVYDSGGQSDVIWQAVSVQGNCTTPP